jgi:hypothetical protein
MKKLFKSLCMAAVAATVLTYTGCATNDQYKDDKEYSDLPWNTPQQWERGPSMPGGMAPNY